MRSAVVIAAKVEDILYNHVNRSIHVLSELLPAPFSNH